MKVCIMRKVRLRYERDSTLKKVVMAKSDTWAQVRAKIAGAFERLPYNSAQIIVSDAELQISSSIPTLGDYLEKFHSGGRTIMGLCIEDDDQSDDGDLDKRISHSKSETCRSRDPSRIDLTCQEEMPLSLSTLSGDGGATVDGVKKSLISDSGVHTAGTSKENKGAFDVKDSTVKGIDDKERDLGLMIYSLDELKKATNNFSASNLLGAGAFGKVFHGYVRHTKVAIKVKADKDSDANIDLNEVAYLSKYRHPHVVQVLGICNDTNKQAIIMELMEGGSLSTHLHEINDLPFIEKRIQILDDAAHGLAYLHCSGVTSKPLLHLDVKSSNILLDCYLRAKVADFGLSKQMPSLPDDKSYVKVTSFRGTRGYMADEYLDGELSTKLDVYSLGVVIVETYTGLKVYDYKRPTKCLVHLVRDALYSLDEFISLCDSKIRSRTIPYLELQSLCRKTLATRENRIDMVEVIELLKGIRRVYNI